MRCLLSRNQRCARVNDRLARGRFRWKRQSLPRCPDASPGRGPAGSRRTAAPPVGSAKAARSRPRSRNSLPPNAGGPDHAAARPLSSWLRHRPGDWFGDETQLVGPEGACSSAASTVPARELRSVAEALVSSGTARGGKRSPPRCAVSVQRMSPTGISLCPPAGASRGDRYVVAEAVDGYARRRNGQSNRAKRGNRRPKIRRGETS